jgi:hypothetical protein
VRQVHLDRIQGGDDKFTTTIIGNDGRLKVIVWDIDNNNIVRQGSATGGYFKKTRTAESKAFRGLVTASVTSQNRLVLNTFTVSSNGQVVAKRSEKQLSTIGSSFSVTSTEGAIVTAYQKTNNKMSIESHALSAGAIIGSRRGIESAGTISEVQILNPAQAGGNLATIVQDSDNRLRLIGWTIDESGNNLRRDGSSVARRAHNISATTMTKSYVGKSARDLIVVAFTNGSTGAFNLQTWDTNLN